MKRTEREAERILRILGQADTGNPEAYLPRPAHRPRLDPMAARVVKSYRVRPDSAARIEREARRTGESQGQIVDRLAADLGSDSVTCENRNLRAQLKVAWREAEHRLGVFTADGTVHYLRERLRMKKIGQRITGAVIDEILTEALAGLYAKCADPTRLGKYERGPTDEPRSSV